MKRVVFLVLVGAAVSARAITCTWDGTTGDWSDGGKWTNGVPTNGDFAVIGGGTVTLAQATESLAALTMTGGTLLFTNWSTKLSAVTVSINTGTVTHAGHSDTNGADGWSLDSRVWIACSNLTVLGKGKIDVVGMGYLGGTGTAASSYASGYGPGGVASYGGGTHGGYGGNNTSALYGVVSAPTNPGSGGASSTTVPSEGAKGGGVVTIEADGTVMVNGSITASGEAGNGYGGAGAAGGSIWITCRSIVGTGSVSAAGGNGKINAVVGAGGGGGRIAVDYNGSAQQQASVPGITFSVAGGTSAGVLNVSGWQFGDLGTLWFTDNQFLKGNLAHKGQWLSPAASGAWSLDTLVISNGWLRFPASGGVLTVTNDVLVTGSGTGLDLGGNTFRTIPVVGQSYKPVNYLFSAPASHELRVGGALTLTNSANMRVYSGVTNGAADYGVLVSVTGAFSLAAGCTTYLYSHWTNGGSPRLEMRDMNLASGAGVNADGGGFGGDVPYGPGGVWARIADKNAGGYHGRRGWVWGNRREEPARSDRRFNIRELQCPCPAGQRRRIGRRRQPGNGGVRWRLRSSCGSGNGQRQRNHQRKRTEWCFTLWGRRVGRWNMDHLQPF